LKKSHNTLLIFTMMPRNFPPLHSPEGSHNAGSRAQKASIGSKEPVEPKNAKRALKIKEEEEDHPGKTLHDRHALEHNTLRIALKDDRKPAPVIKADPIIRNMSVASRSAKRNPTSEQGQNYADDDRKPAFKIKADPEDQDDSPRYNKRRASTQHTSEPVLKRAKKQDPRCRTSTSSNDILRSEQRHAAKEDISPGAASRRREIEAMSAAHDAALKEKETVIGEWEAKYKGLVTEKQTIEIDLAAMKEIYEASLEQKETELEEWKAKYRRQFMEKGTIEANLAAARETIAVLQQDQLTKHDETSEPDRGVAGLPRRLVAGWNAADYNCKPASETSEDEDDSDNDDGDGDEGYDDETDLSGRAPPATIVDTSTPHPRRSPRTLITTISTYAPSPFPTATVNEDDDDEGYDDDTDLSGRAPPATIVDASTPHPRRSPRALMTTRSTSSSPSPSSTASVNESYSRQSRHQTVMSAPTEVSEEQVDEDEDEDEDGDGDHGDGEGDSDGDDDGNDNANASGTDLADLVSWDDRSSRRVISTSSTVPPIAPPTTAIEASTGRQSHAWDARLIELADYRKIHGHCNVPKNYSKNTQLGTWVSYQRQQYNLYIKGKNSCMTLSRTQALESLGFKWNRHGATWDDRLSQLADYRRIHGHCNVPQKYSENTQLGEWVSTQRSQYKSRIKGNNKLRMTLPRIQELEGLGFEWNASLRRG
jgi:hypothetical protein